MLKIIISKRGGGRSKITAGLPKFTGCEVKHVIIFIVIVVIYTNSKIGHLNHDFCLREL